MTCHLALLHTATSLSSTLFFSLPFSASPTSLSPPSFCSQHNRAYYYIVCTIVQHSLLCIQQPAFLFHHIFLSAYKTLHNWHSNNPSLFAPSQHQHRPPTQHLRLSTYTTPAVRNHTSPFQQRLASFSISIQHTLDQHSGPWFSFSACTSTISHLV